MNICRIVREGVQSMQVGLSRVGCAIGQFFSELTRKVSRVFRKFAETVNPPLREARLLRRRNARLRKRVKVLTTQRCQKCCVQMSDKLRKVQADVAQVKNALAQQQASIVRDEKAACDAEQRFQAKAAEEQASQAKLESVRNELTEAVKEKARIEKLIKEHTDGLDGGASGELRDKLIAAVSELNELLDVATAKVTSLETERDRVTAAIAAAMDECDVFRATITQLQGNIASLKEAQGKNQKLLEQLQKREKRVQEKLDEAVAAHLAGGSPQVVSFKPATPKTQDGAVVNQDDAVVSQDQASSSKVDANDLQLVKISEDSKASGDLSEEKKIVAEANKCRETVDQFLKAQFLRVLIIQALTRSMPKPIFFMGPRSNVHASGLNSPTGEPSRIEEINDEDNDEEAAPPVVRRSRRVNPNLPKETDEDRVQFLARTAKFHR